MGAQMVREVASKPQTKRGEHHHRTDYGQSRVSQKVADERGFPSIDLDRPTLAFWVSYAAELMPLTFCVPSRFLEWGGSRSLLATAFSERASARARA
jgi:hypothetical protein